jgi:hypothetical protein
VRCRKERTVGIFFSNKRRRPKADILPKYILPSSLFAHAYYFLSVKININGEMQEWLNWPLSKSGVAETLPRVRIPLSPPRKKDDHWAVFFSWHHFLFCKKHARLQVSPGRESNAAINTGGYRAHVRRLFGVFIKQPDAHF